MFTHYEAIVTVYDVCDMLLIGKNRVYELLESGELKGFKIGRVWKIPRESVEEYIRRRSGLKK